ncbi:MAG: hypothetical protein RL708_1187 [Bacteroidota bacterium]|jgi:hypothetical protein
MNNLAINYTSKIKTKDILMYRIAPILIIAFVTVQILENITLISIIDFLMILILVFYKITTITITSDAIIIKKKSLFFLLSSKKIFAIKTIKKIYINSDINYIQSSNGTPMGVDTNKIIIELYDDTKNEFILNISKKELEYLNEKYFRQGSCLHKH